MDILTLKKAQKYTDKKAQEIKLKISQIEKELDNYQQTMAMVNINQEPTQQAVGAGVVSLPKNAAEGQFKGASLRGITEGTTSTIGACRLRSVSEDESEESTAYIIAKDEAGNIVELKSLPNGVCDTIEDGKLIKRVGASILKADDIVNISTSLVNVSVVIIRKPVDYVGFGNNESPAPERMNMTGELIKGYVYSDDVSSLGHVYSINNNFFGFIIEKGTTLAQAREKLAGMKITYQLAEPEIIPIEVSGTLLSNPSGTVHVENAVADAGLYTDKITVLQQDLPIRELEKIARVDFVTGQETELDITQAVISTDKLSFTHPDLADGDIVFFTYFYDREGTLGEVTLEYYDSRYTIKDTANEKFYQWKIISTNGTPSIALVEV